MTDKNKIGKPAQAPDMADLLEYFETRSRALDKEGQPMLDPSTLQFMSLIKFNGVSILPPVLNDGRREEMISYKHEALRREKMTRVRKTEELQAKVQSIVAGVEERRAAKQASKSIKTPASSSPSSRKSSSERTATSESTSRVTTRPIGKSASGTPSEIIINISGSSKDATSSPSRSSSKASPKSVSSASTKSTMSPSRSVSHSSSDAKKKDYTNYKSLSKLGALSKQKSFSSQHLDKSGVQMDPSKSVSHDLLPHPPVGRPPSRGSMRQSSSTPDLRSIDHAVKKEELVKPIKSGRSLSPKGGRPQAPERDNVKETRERPESRAGKTREKENSKEAKGRENKTKQEVFSKTRENVNEQKSRKSEMSMKKASDARTTSTSSKATSKTESDGSVHSRRKAADPHSSQIHNPLEALEQELTREDENEKRKRLSGSSQGSMGDVRPKVFEEVRQELDPIQTATAELFPFLISEEQAMATLDSLQPEFASLEQQDSLPKDYNGIPLTSLKQQQIIHMLTKLSKALNMEETLTSTTSTAVGGEQPRQDSLRGSTLRGEGDYRSVHEGAIGGRGSVHSEYAEGHDMPDEMSVNMTADSSYHNSSNTSAHSRARMSPTGSSILSSASSVSGSRRMSPKSLKNTVHFSTLVTEISTSASQSYEDKISYRKLDITPKNSENFEDQQQMDENSQSRNIESEEMTPYSMAARGSNLLSKVALSPSVDTSSGSPGEFSHNHPFDTSNQESDLNTSDKENEYIPADPDSSDDNYSGEMNVRTGRNQPVLNVYMANMPAGPIGENHPAVVHVKSSVKSELSEGSTLKESSDKVLQENVSRTNMKLDSNNYYGTSGNDFENLIQGKHSVSDSITSMQEEITRSYMMSQMRPEKDTSDIDELKKQRKVVRKKLDIDDSVVLLQPVVFTNTGNSLQENRSMLEEEERIRNNLDRVHFEDSDTESDDDNVVNMEHPKQVTVDNAEHPEQITVVSNGEHEANMNHVHVTEPNVNAIREIDDNCDDGNDDQNDESSEEEEEDVESEVEESEGDEEEPVQDVEVDDSKPHAHNEIDETDIDVIKVQEVDEHTGAADNQVEKEEEAKAEHIQRYLNQVHEQSLHHDDNESVNDDDDVPPSKSQSFVEVMDNIGALIGSFTANIQSMNHLSQEELFQMQSQQFELIQQKLIEHQRAQLEELFVAQRREQMSLEKEIEAYHMKIESDVQSPAVSEINLEPVFNVSYNPPPPGPAAPVQPVMNGGVMAPPPQPMCSTMNPQGPAGYNRPMDPLKPRISNTMPQVTQAWQAYPHQPVHSSAKSPPFTVQPVASTIPYHNPNMSFNTSYSSVGPYQDPRLGMTVGMDPRSGVNYPIGYMADPNISSISHNTSYSTIPHRDPGMLRGNIHQPPNLDVIHSQDPGSSHTGSNPFIYPSSPSLYVDPKDRDNVSEVSGFAKATPKQLMFSNQSTPVQPGRPFKPIQHSPVKQPSVHYNAGPYHVPDKVFHPSMHHKFSKVTAAVRGYLTRRLLRTPKVQEIIKTIADTRNFAFSFQAETPIKKGNFTREDRILLERIVNQLQAALLDIHEIFFLIPISERMAIIASSRQLEEEKMMRTSQRRSMDNVSRSQPKLSKATLKAMERKKKAQLAEESVFGSMELRPKSAPPATSSPLTSTDIRALRPLQGQISPIGTDRQITVREMKERPRTATEKRKSGDGSNKTRKSTGSKTTKTTTNSTNPVKHKSSKDKPQSSTAVKDKDKTKGVNTVSKTRKSEKSWR